MFGIIFDCAYRGLVDTYFSFSKLHYFWTVYFRYQYILKAAMSVVNHWLLGGCYSRGLLVRHQYMYLCVSISTYRYSNVRTSSKSHAGMCDKMFCSINLWSKITTHNYVCWFSWDRKEVILRHFTVGVKPIIHQSELRTYTKVVPFKENSSFHFVVLWQILNGLA